MSPYGPATPASPPYGCLWGCLYVCGRLYGRMDVCGMSLCMHVCMKSVCLYEYSVESAFSFVLGRPSAQKGS